LSFSYINRKLWKYQQQQHVRPPFFRRPDDGLERELDSFGESEGGVCMMCAPGDQRKAGNNTLSRPNKLRYLQVGQFFLRRVEASSELPKQIIARLNSRKSSFEMTASGAKRPFIGNQLG
jgi:hypothetical protein